MEEFRESKMRYLEMIQNVITRMASNSFSLRGWVVTLVAGILALSSKDSDKHFFLIAFIPIFIFWFLDSYYFQLERKYRRLFEYIRTKDQIEKMFEMNLKNTKEFIGDNKDTKFILCFFSKYEFWFYFPIAITVVAFLKLTKVI